MEAGEPNCEEVELVCTWGAMIRGRRGLRSAFGWVWGGRRKETSARRGRGEEDVVVEDAGLLAPGALYVSVVYTATALPPDNIKKEALWAYNITPTYGPGLDSTTKVDSAKKPGSIVLSLGLTFSTTA